MTRAHLKFLAKQQLGGKVGVLFLASLLVFVIPFVSGFAVGLVVGLLSTLEEVGVIIGVVLALAFAVAMSIVITPALSIGRIMMLQHIANHPYETVKATYVFKGFKHFWVAFKVHFFIGLFTFLWSLLGIIPGIIKTYSYSQALYIVAENPEMGALAAINRSKMMMRGRKFDLYVLMLSYYPWFLLLPYTLGILSVWLVPYMELTNINFYNHAKRVPGSPDYGIPTYGDIIPAHSFMPTFMSGFTPAENTAPQAPVAEQPVAQPIVQQPVVEEPAEVGIEDPGVIEEPTVVMENEVIEEPISVEDTVVLEEPISVEDTVALESPAVEPIVEEIKEEPASEEQSE